MRWRAALGPYNTGPCVLGLRGRAEDPLACLPSGFYTGTYKYKTYKFEANFESI